MTHPAGPLPLLPTALLRRYHCAEPTDTRFRAVARLRQSLWREEQGWACGRYLDAHGRSRRLGSLLEGTAALHALWASAARNRQAQTQGGADTGPTPTGRSGRLRRKRVT